MDSVGNKEKFVNEGSYEDRPAEDISRHEEERKLEDGSDEDMKVHGEADGSDEDVNIHGEEDGSDENMNWHEEEYEEDGAYQRRYTYGSYRYRGSYEDRNWYGEAAAFEQIYQCYPPIYADRPELEKANKLILPPSALSRLISQEIEYPILFQLQNTITGRISHCGVLEFVAEEGIIYMPLWMMEYMLLQPGDTVKLKHTTLPKGTCVKLQPHTKNFLDIFNPKALLEVSLRNFSCLTTGDTIKIDYNDTTYCINIVETKPESAISVFDTDLEVDFVPPLDYKESESLPLNPATTSAKDNPATEHEEKSECRFIAFTGVGRRLNGKPVSPRTKSPKVKAPRPMSRSPSIVPIRKPGKLVFGHNTIKTQSTETGKVAAQKSEKQSDEADKFQPFTGRKYSLKD